MIDYAQALLKALAVWRPEWLLNVLAAIILNCYVTSVPLKVVVTEQVRSIINWDYC